MTTMTTKISLLVVLALAVMLGRGESQPAPPTKLTIGIYAPSVEFGTAQQRLTYVQSLAKAIETNTGIKTEAQSFASLGALKSGKVDFAIVDGQCYAANLGWKLLANAEVGGGTTRTWALYASGASDMQGLRGKKLAFIQMGCNDKAFVDNAMLETEIDDTFFASRVGKPDLSAAVAEVASLKGAQAVFAPAGAQKGLTKVFDTGAVPNPAFVQLNTSVSAIPVRVLVRRRFSAGSPPRRARCSRRRSRARSDPPSPGSAAAVRSRAGPRRRRRRTRASRGGWASR